MKLYLLVLATLLVGASAHLCLLYPHQRGTANDLNTAGANDCLLTDSPCGRRMKETPLVELTGGSTASIVFQKNLDHFNSKSPGTLVVRMGPDENNLKEIVSIPDTDAGPTKQKLYTVNVHIPAMKGEAVLQVEYVTNNPEAPAEFYQCADVMVK